MRRFIPQVFSGLRARLVVGFLVVVAIALALMFATLPRLLDGYFAQQSTDDLQLRAGQVRAFVSRELANYVFGGGAAPRPILMPTEQPVIADEVRQTLSPESAFMTQLLPIARADISISIAIDAEHPDQVAYSVVAPFSDERAESGQQREPISADAVFQNSRSILVAVGRRRAAAAGDGHPVRSVHLPRPDPRDDRRGHGHCRRDRPCRGGDHIDTHRRPDLQPHPAADRCRPPAVGGSARHACPAARQLARDGRVDGRLQLDGRARPGIDRVHPP